MQMKYCRIKLYDQTSYGSLTNLNPEKHVLLLLDLLPKYFYAMRVKMFLEELK